MKLNNVNDKFVNRLNSLKLNNVNDEILLNNISRLNSMKENICSMLRHFTNVYYNFCK